MEPQTPIKSGTSFSGWAKVVRAVRSPLGFFVLALLIVESFLLGAGIWFNLPVLWKISAIGMGVLLFLIVFFTVVYLVIYHPKNLVFSEESHVEFEALKIYGNEGNTITMIELERLRVQTQPSAISGNPQPLQIDRPTGQG